jgi:hypothetical protein
VPGTVVEATVIVIVDVPVPVIEVGLKETVTPVGWPFAVSATAELKPPLVVLVMVEVPVLPSVTETAEGEAERVKPAADVTVRVTLVVSTIVPDVPVTVMG